MQVCCLDPTVDVAGFLAGYALELRRQGAELKRLRKQFSRSNLGMEENESAHRALLEGHDAEDKAVQAIKSHTNSSKHDRRARVARLQQFKAAVHTISDKIVFLGHALNSHRVDSWSNGFELLLQPLGPEGLSIARFVEHVAARECELSALEIGIQLRSIIAGITPMYEQRELSKYTRTVREWSDSRSRLGDELSGRTTDLEIKAENQWNAYQDKKDTKPEVKRTHKAAAREISLTSFDEDLRRDQQLIGVFEMIKGQLKIVVGHFQVLSALESSVLIDWPSDVSKILETMSILLLDIYGIFGIACWNGGSQSNVNAMWVLIGFACVVTLMLYPIYWIFVGVLKKPKVQMKTRIVKFGLLFLFVIYPGVSLKAMQVFECRQIGDSYFKVQDIRIECYVDSWVDDAVVAAITLCVLTIGYPLVIALKLMTYRPRFSFDDELNNQHIKPAHERYRFLFVRYKPEFYLWELVETARKLMLTSIIIFVKPGSAVQVVFAIAVSVFFLCLQYKFRPYLLDTENLLDRLCKIALCVTYMYGTLVTNDQDSLPWTIVFFSPNFFVLLWLGYILCTTSCPNLWENRLHYFATLEAIFDGDDEEHEKYDLMMHKFVMDLDGNGFVEREEWEAQNRGSMALFDEIDVDEDGRLSSDELVLYEKRCCQAKSDVGVTISMQEMEMQDLTEGDHEDKDDEENPYPLVVG